MESLGNLDLGGYANQFSPQNHHGSNYVDIAVVGSGGVFRQEPPDRGRQWRPRYRCLKPL